MTTKRLLLFGFYIIGAFVTLNIGLACVNKPDDLGVIFGIIGIILSIISFIKAFKLLQEGWKIVMTEDKENLQNKKKSNARKK